MSLPLFLHAEHSRLVQSLIPDAPRLLAHFRRGCRADHSTSSARGNRESDLVSARASFERSNRCTMMMRGLTTYSAATTSFAPDRRKICRLSLSSSSSSLSSTVLTCSDFLSNARRAGVCPPLHLSTPYYLRRCFHLSASAATHYDTLGLKATATQKEIKSAFYLLSKRLHPDFNPNTPDAVERFKQINAAYEVLGNPLKRKEYDAELLSRDELELTSDVAEGEGGIRVERRPKTDPETEGFLRRMKAVGFIVGYFFFVVYFYMNWF